MVESKAWDWSKNESSSWLEPAVEAYYLCEKWRSKGFSRFLDLGCGLGRHSIYFAKQGFEVSSVDLSSYGVEHLKSWSSKESLNIEIKNCDMTSLDFCDNTFDCIMAYNVIYHTDMQGLKKSIAEIRRVLKPKGELFITLLSKNSITYNKAPKDKHIDRNTILRDEDITEKNVPHFYVNIEDIKQLFNDFELVTEPIEQTDYDLEGNERSSKHFNLLLF